MVDRLDGNLRHFAAIVERDLRAEILNLPGAGAAGGLGGGLVTFASAKLRPGVELIIEAVELPRRLADADLCLTGEGAIDEQSAFGKTAVGVGRLARSLGCPALALAGSLGPGSRSILEMGINACFSICPGPISLDQAMAAGSELLERATEQVVRAFLAAGDPSRGER
jgi:glycerate kinase